MAVPLKFSLNRDILSGGGDLALQLDAGDTALANALVRNTALPRPSDPVILGSAAVGVEADRQLSLGSDKMTVLFGASASAKFGLFSLPSQLRTAIVDGGDLADTVEAALNFDTGSEAPFLLLRLGYNVDGAASGAVALGAAGTLKFAANASRAGMYAVVHEPAAGRGARDAVADIVRSVRLPRQVKTADDLLPGTWIIAEADGSLGFRGEVKFGHDFSWIRQTALGTLKGDIGLKVAAGVTASLGFNVAGKYAVVVSRASLSDDDKKVRVRVFKLRMREFDFAFRAEATVTPVSGLLPNQLDDFIKGVLGVHGTQIVAALGRVRDWTDPEQPIFGPFVDLAVDEAKELIGRIVDIQDVVARFNDARGRIQKLFDRWDALPADVTARLLKVIDDNDAVARIRETAGKLANADTDAVKSFIRSHLQNVDFLRSPAGEVAQKLIAKGLFAAVTNNDLLDEVQSRARQLLEVLDGDLVEGMLKRLQKEINERLKLDQIEQAVAAADPAKLDPWLRARLEDFLEEKLGADALARLEEIRAAIRRITELGPEFYKKALAALRRDYQFSLSADYQKASTATALIDAEFDFNVDTPEATEGLRVCLAGGFDALIDKPRPGVTVGEGVLTHAITRQTNVKVVLPYFERTTTHVTKALASLKAPTDVGSELLFQLEASDVVTVKNQHSASLTIAMLLPRNSAAPAADHHDVRIHDKSSASYQQSLDAALTKASAADLVDYAGPLVKSLFQQELGGDFSAWIQDAFGDLPALGNALLALDVTLPPEACLAWTKAPADPKADVYQRLSLALQARYRQLVHDVFFHSIDAFEDVGAGSGAFAVLVFASLTPATGARINGTRLELAPAHFATSDVHWNIEDEALLSAITRSGRVRNALTPRLAAARRRLQAAGRQRLAEFYKDMEIDHAILGAAIDRDPGRSVFRSLLFVEREIVTRARTAALKMAAFNAHQDAARARRDLAEFGLKVTDTFNARLGNVAVGGALRPLGALMFITAAQELDPSLAVSASAMLNIIDVRDDVKFPPDGFPNHDPVAEADIVRSETLVHVAE
jgi:hypothetical protein